MMIIHLAVIVANFIECGNKNEANRTFQAAAGEEYFSTKLLLNLCDQTRFDLWLTDVSEQSKHWVFDRNTWHSLSTTCMVTKVKENMNPNKVIIHGMN